MTPDEERPKVKEERVNFIFVLVVSFYLFALIGFLVWFEKRNPVLKFAEGPQMDLPPVSTC